MKPVILTLGTFQLYSFGLAVALGVMTVVFLMTRRARLQGFPDPDTVLDIVFFTVVCGLAGGRILFVFENASLYADRPLSMLAIWEGGLIFFGGLAASLAGLTLFLRFKKIPVLRGFDFLAPFAALVHAFGRVGCFLNGCCAGKVCDLPWSVRFPGESFSRHPTQLYEVGWNLFLFLVLSRVQKRPHGSGTVLGLYLSGYGFGRFVIEFFRAGNPTWFIFTHNQWISLALAAGGLLLYARGRRRAP